MYEEATNEQSRSWFYVTAGLLCTLLFVNVAVFDLYVLYLYVQYQGVTIS